MAVSTYSVTLHHLAPGATAAGLQYPDEPLANVTPVQLRDLLNALSLVAADLTIYEPSMPEIRIKTDRDVFVVRTRYRQLCLVGWETTLRGEEHSVPYIITTVAGGAAEVARIALVKVDRPPTAGSAAATDAKTAAASNSRRTKIAIMAVLILGFNGATAWMLFRPTPTLTPAYELMAETDSRTLLIKAAGDYQTGKEPGDRHLSIAPDGTLRFAKYGPAQALLEPRVRPSAGAVVAGKPVLITNDKNPAIVEIKDADTVICTKTTYTRIQR
jgi:hypothetical protein